MKNKFTLYLFLVVFALLLVGCNKTTSPITTAIETTSSTTSLAQTTTTNIITTEVLTTVTITDVPTTEPVYFTVTFMQDDIILKQEAVLQGASATPPSNTDKPSTLEFIYTFNGWDEDFTNVQTDLVINAIYIETVILYDVTFYDYDGLTIIDIVKVPYNTSATPPANIETRTDEIYTYTFDTWIGDFTNITQDTLIYSSYIRTYTTTGDYEHLDFYNLVASTFSLSDETNIENNITYLTEIFEAETEEEAYRIFNILVYNYDQLTEFANFEEFKLIFSNLESGFLTDERLVSILFNFLKHPNSYFVGLSDLEFTWYNEVILNYNNFQDQYDVIRDAQNQIDYELNQALLLLEESLRSDAFDYFYAKTSLYSIEQQKFDYFNYLKTYIGNDIYNLNTAIWNIIDQENIDPLLYNFYVTQYNQICNAHPLYLDKIETFYQIMEEYYLAVHIYEPLDILIKNNTDYQDFITTSDSLYSTFAQSINSYLLIKDDIEYWERQLNGINASMQYLDLAREILSITENEELYQEALLILIDDIQNMVINGNDLDFAELASLVTYIVNNRDMYGYLDTTTLFEVVTKEGLFNVLKGISNILDLRYETITPEEWTLLDEAIYYLSVDYANTLEEYEYDLEQEIIDTYIKATNYFLYFDVLVTEIHTLIYSITFDEVERFETLVVNQDIYTQNENTIELAKLIYDIYIDSSVDVHLFVDSYMYLNYFQIDVNIDFDQLPSFTNDFLFRLEEFLIVAEYIANTDPIEILESTLIKFYEDFNDWYHDFLYSYMFYQ